MSVPARVAIIMGSDSDAEYIEKAALLLDDFGIAYTVRVISAHRTPDRLVEMVSSAEARGLKVLIAVAGWAAALAGIMAAHTSLPVIGVPIPSSPLAGLDAILSTLQMPAGVPVATMSLGSAGAQNAAIFAAEILALSDPELARKVAARKQRLADEVALKDQQIQARFAR